MKLLENERINEINENLRLIEKKDSLTFGTDAYLLSAYLPKRQKLIGVELGCGSGVISFLALTKKKCQYVYGIEVQKDIASVAGRNGELNALDEAFSVINKDLRDLTVSDIKSEVDFVFSNPPYMKVDSGKANENDLKNISRHEVCGNIEDFCKCAGKLLKHGGSFYTVYRPDRMIDLISAMRNNGIEPKRLTFIHTNTHTSPSLLLIQGKKGGKSGLKIDKPIYIYKDGTTEYTEEFNKIYENCEIEDIR